MNRSYYKSIQCENRTNFWETDTDTETDILQPHPGQTPGQTAPLGRHPPGRHPPGRHPLAP